MTSLELARQEIEAAMHDVINEHGEDGWDAAAFDVITNIAMSYTPKVRAEILRTELGLTLEESRSVQTFPDTPRQPSQAARERAAANRAARRDRTITTWQRRI